ncbi:MAG: ATP-binding cassette domain-containing protein [Saprospiraceae bacterium]|nr:ATP-binding cassette domain-containing protein [Saprospiraceae bacterium]
MDITDTSFSPMQRFWRLMVPDKKEIRNVYIYSIFYGLVYLSLPLGIQAIVNIIQGGQVNTAWIVLVSIVVLGVAVSGILQIFQLRITENLQQKIFSRAAFELAFRVPRIKMEVLYRHYAPELMNRFFDTISVQKGLSKILIDFSIASLQVLFGLILLSFYHPFFIMFGVLMIFLVYVIFRFTAFRGLQTSLVESKHKYKVAHWLEELARTANTFRLAGHTSLPMERTNDHVGDYLQARESHFKILIRQYSLVVVFKVIVAAGLLAVGGFLVMDQKMNIGQFVAAEIIILMVMSSVEKIFLSLETIYDVLTALEKIGQVTDMALENSEGFDLSNQKSSGGLEVNLEDVSFTYPGHTEPALSDINLILPPGSCCIITGENGSGKSTLLNVIAGLYDIEEGSLSYDALPLGNLKISTLRRVIGECLAQELLFEGTLLENIHTGRENATFEKVQWAVENVGLKEFIRGLPKGYNTMIDPQGKKLPRSIIQKILLARSIAGNPRLLLLEAVFENLDPKECQKIIDFLFSPEHSWTIIAVSINPYLAQKSDKILALKEGRIIAEGDYKTMKDIANLQSDTNA